VDRNGQSIEFVRDGWNGSFGSKGGNQMPSIVFRGGDKDGKYEDYLVDPEISLLVFDGYGGLGSPKGRYQKTTEVIEVDGVKATVWVLIDSMR
jgi:hypothetical protein